MIYKRNNIHDLIADVQKYIKAPYTPRWCIVVDEKGKEYHDENFWITDGITLWFVPINETAPTSKRRKSLPKSELRKEYESDLLKMQKRGDLIRKPTKNDLEKMILAHDDYLPATSFELDFHPLSGFSVLCKTGQVDGRLDIRYLFRYKTMSKEFEFLDEFSVEVSQSSRLVRVVKDKYILGISAPIVGQEDIPY